VRETGTAVRGASAGDKVVLSFPSCGKCRRWNTGRTAYCDSIAELEFSCSRAGGSVATTMRTAGRSVSTFLASRHSGLCVANARSAVRVPNDLDLRLAGPLACGV